MIKATFAARRGFSLRSADITDPDKGAMRAILNLRFASSFHS
jgi:hypothetical protein